MALFYFIEKSGLTCESQSSPGIEMWLDVLEPPPPPPFVQGTLVDMDSIMEHVSGSQDLLLSLLLSLFVDVTTFAAAAAAKSSEKKNRNMYICNQEKSILEGS